MIIASMASCSWWNAASLQDIPIDHDLWQQSSFQICLQFSISISSDLFHYIFGHPQAWYLEDCISMLDDMVRMTVSGRMTNSTPVTPSYYICYCKLIVFFQKFVL